MASKVPTRATLDKWRGAIKENGATRLKVRLLLRQFGAERRGSATCARIDEFLAGALDEREEVAPLYVNWSGAKNLDSAVTISTSKTEQLDGDLWEGHENAFERKYEEEILRHMKLTYVEREYSPKGTRDRLDLLAKDGQGRFVVIEIKTKWGQKRAVEQVLRYIEYIRKDKATDEVLGVLVTGVGDESTRAALSTLERPELFSWYLYALNGEELLLRKQRLPTRG